MKSTTKKQLLWFVGLYAASLIVIGSANTLLRWLVGG